MVKTEWLKYRVGEPSRTAWVNQDCEPFKTVHHVCHLDDAVRIIEDGLIRSSLVWDESRLNNSRTCVSWLSPNSWGNGSIYGNIQFNFDWNKIIDGKNIYWVEAISKYNPPAYRILITESDFSSKGLRLYDPTLQDGPIYFEKQSNTWFRNGKYTGELLIDEDLPLSESISVEFCGHHPQVCRKNGSNCSYLNSDAAHIGSRFIALIIGRNLKKARKLMVKLNGDKVEDIYSGIINFPRPYGRGITSIQTSFALHLLSRALLRPSSTKKMQGELHPSTSRSGN